MATLADSFLADFESDGEEDSEQEESDQDESAFKTLESSSSSSSSSGSGAGANGKAGVKNNNNNDDDLDLDEGGNKKSDFVQEDVKDLDAIDDLDQMDKAVELPAGSAVSAIATLLNDESVQRHIDVVTKLVEQTAKEAMKQEEEHSLNGNGNGSESSSSLSSSSSSDGTSGNGNANALLIDIEAEYDTLVTSNEMVSKIDSEIATIHKFIRDLYATKYQELEQLVVDPITYAQVVKIIGNETDMTLVEPDLVGIIPQTTVLTISVTATTTIGKPLPPQDLEKLIEGCDAILKLNEFKTAIFMYVETRMGMVAPNLSALVGTDIAARLIGIAGGLTQLSKIPSCNLQVLGVNRRANMGFARTKENHMGLLIGSEVMRTTPSDLRQRVLRVLAGKCTLAARIDSFNEDPSGRTGQEMLEEIAKKIDKWQEPPPPKKKKALTAPLGDFKKKRGGKRSRREKEKYKVTDMQKQKNRMPFAKAEMTDDYTGEGYGMLGLAGSGRLTVKKKEKTLKNQLSRNAQARLRRVKGSGQHTPGTPGTASSIATPFQGMELVAPPEQNKAPEKVKGGGGGAGGKYFAQAGGFLRVGGTTSIQAPKKQKTA